MPRPAPKKQARVLRRNRTLLKLLSGMFADLEQMCQMVRVSTVDDDLSALYFHTSKHVSKTLDFYAELAKIDRSPHLPPLRKKSIPAPTARKGRKAA